MKEVTHDRVGKWTEIKEEIIREYASAYSKVLSNQQLIKSFAFIDGFAGSGKHLTKEGKEIAGSPLIALKTDPPFKHYYFIDLDKSKTD